MKIFILFTAYLILLFTNLIFSQGISFEKIYPTNGVSSGQDVIEKTENGYLVVGGITPFSTSVLVMNIDINGNLISEKHLLPGAIVSVTNSYDNNYILAGNTYDSGILVLKTTTEGDTIWSKTINRPNIVKATKIINTSDSGYAIIGWIQNNNHNIYLVKTDKDCDTLWSKSYGDWKTDLGYDIRELPDKGFIIAGTTTWDSNYQIYYLAYVIRTDSIGTLLWSRRYSINGTAKGDGVVVSIAGDIVVAGSTYNTDPFSPELYLLTLNMDGDSLSVKTFGEIMRGGISSIQPTLGGQYIMTGNGGLLKVDINGNIIWFKPLNGKGLSVKQTSDEGYIVSGVTNDGNYDILLVKTTKDGTVNIEEELLVPSDYILSQCYPNPFNPTTNIAYSIPELSFIKLKVYDVLGNEIATLVNGEKPIGNYGVEFNGMGFPSGIYFYKLQAGSFVETKKMVLMK